MKSKLNYETIKINKILFDKNLEQTIDFEYNLPDYCTGIFKVLKFYLKPNISSCRESNKQFIIDGTANMKLLYLDEEGGNIKAIHQNIPFSKTLNLEEDINNATIFYDVKTNYKNCKIISSKKIDVKATLTIHVKIQTQQEQDILKNSTRTDIQFKYEPVSVTCDQIYATQQFNINEQIEFESLAKEILDVRINISDNEFKVISNKIICKSLANIEILYFKDKNTFPTLQKTSIPLNNIVDMPNINENYIYSVKYDITSTNFEILQEGKFLNVSANVVINSYGNLCENVEMVSDVFSTKYELDAMVKEFNFSNLISTINEEITLNEYISSTNIQNIFDADVDIIDINYTQNNKQADFKVKLNFILINLY